jgi:hypothetical protein
MSRPHDWWILDLEGDPTPGSPAAVRRMARTWSAVADDAAWAETRVRQLMGDEALGKWIGEAGDAFRSKTGDLPDQLGKCADSYGQAADALTWWAGRLETHQGDADQALSRGRVAHGDLEDARRRASAAAAAVSSASGVPALNDPSLNPTPDQIRDARSRLSSAQAARSSADSAVSAAQSRLDAARRLALDAKHLRENDGRTAAGRIHEAADAGIPERSRWEKFKEWAGEAWDVIVTIAKVVVAVLGIVALIIGGPLAWVVFAAALVLLADAIMRYMKGECSLWEVGLAALGCIPGTKGLTTLAELRMAFQAGGMLGAGAHILGAGRQALAGMATAVRSLGSGAVMHIRTSLAELALSASLRRGLEPLSVLDELARPLPMIERNNPFLYAQELERLGAADLPTSGTLGDLLRGYDRYGTAGDADTFLNQFVKADGSWDWPGNAGFDGPRVDITHQPGDVLDRFGPPDGRYLSPDGTSFAERAIPPSNLDPMAPNLGYHRYEVIRPFDAPTGYVSPAFGQPGQGLQIFIDGGRFGGEVKPGEWVNVQWLMDHGYLREIGVP